MSLDKQVNQVREILLSEMEKSKSVIFDGLLNNPFMNKIPESLFVNYFLPCFLGNNTNNPNWVMEWISIAGTPMSELGVVKDGTNELLYTVPSILNTNNLFLNKQEGDIGDIFSKYEQINNNIPLQGLNFLINALNSKNEELLNKVNFSDVNRRWIDILSRYNLVKSDTIETSKNNSDDNNFNDYFET
jgi:hypothetical protein